MFFVLSLALIFETGSESVLILVSALHRAFALVTVLGLPKYYLG